MFPIKNVGKDILRKTWKWVFITPILLAGMMIGNSIGPIGPAKVFNRGLFETDEFWWGLNVLLMENDNQGIIVIERKTTISPQSREFMQIPYEPPTRRGTSRSTARLTALSHGLFVQALWLLTFPKPPRGCYSVQPSRGWIGMWRWRAHRTNP